jgi:hypothetical protein
VEALLVGAEPLILAEAEFCPCKRMVEALLLSEALPVVVVLVVSSQLIRNPSVLVNRFLPLLLLTSGNIEKCSSLVLPARDYQFTSSSNR